MAEGASQPNGQKQASSVTDLLRGWGGGNLAARDELLAVVYRDLRQRAAGYLRRERVGHTLQPTALVHEAYLRLVDQKATDWKNRGHFFGVAAQMMRRILVDHARARAAAKRPRVAVSVAIDAVGATPPQSLDVLLLDQALSDLAAFDPQQAQIVELRYFGGLSETDVAVALDLSRSTVTRDWQAARAWLYRRMTHGRPP